MPAVPQKLLFIINPRAGKNKINWTELIQDYFTGKPTEIELFELPDPCHKKVIQQHIDRSRADVVVAVGGDGTLKLVAEVLQGTNTAVGLVPGGSANGMAKELQIPADPLEALEVVMTGRIQGISLIRINDELCIHLSDLGFNAYVVKKFEEEHKRGMWSYVKSAWKVLWTHDRMKVSIQIDNEYIEREAAMVVIANATRYGTGVVINPQGRLDDALFEVVIVKKVSFSEIFKMRFMHRRFNPSKTELLQTSALRVESSKSIHFQVDGEYLGKVQSVKASILPQALQMIVPSVAKNI